MASVGASWGKDGKVTIQADGTSGNGEITDLTPHNAMYLAVILARNARACGVPWPGPRVDDPWENAAVAGLQVALREGGRQVEPEIVKSPDVDLDELEFHLDEANLLVRRALRELTIVHGLLRSPVE